jgi:hypothetical protein
MDPEHAKDWDNVEENGLKCRIVIIWPDSVSKRSLFWSPCIGAAVLNSYDNLSSRKKNASPREKRHVSPQVISP